jgi:hypothetical protein
MIRGSLDRLHFGDLLQWFQMGSVSGRLTLMDARGRRRLDFRNGRVCYASSTIPEERLATWFARRSLVGADTVRKILATSMLRRTLFTDLLMSEGEVSKEELRQSLTDLAESITSRILTSGEVHFEFEPDFPIVDVLGLSLQLEPSHLLMEAARRTDESETASSGGSASELEFTGEAFEDLFWELARDGISGADAVDGWEMSHLHDLVRDIVGTLAQWLASSPGLVPLPPRQIDDIRQCHAGEENVCLYGLSHAAWNQMVFACTVPDADRSAPLSMGELESRAAEINMWGDLIGSEYLQRPEAGKLDALVRHVVVTWSRTAAAAAPHLGVDPEAASLAVHLVAVPTDLVLWVLTTLPVPHQRLRKALLKHLARRVGARLAHLADFPSTISSVLDPTAATPLGLALHIGRGCVPAATTWPLTVPSGGLDFSHLASPPTLALAADAARAVAEEALENDSALAG